jgi:hypothetical protein
MFKNQDEALLKLEEFVYRLDTQVRELDKDLDDTIRYWDYIIE